MSRYLISAMEQALWSALNLGVSLLLIRVCAPNDYGAFVFWSNCAYVLSSLQNAISICHLQVLSPGSGLDEARLPVERLMHGVNGVFLVVVGAVTLACALALRGTGSVFGAPAAALFLPAFLLQQYIRALAFSRGAPVTAMVQTGAVLIVASSLLGGAVLVLKSLTADQVLICIGAAYGGIGVVGAARALRGQAMSRLKLHELRAYVSYAAQSGWIFLGVTTTELLARFYAFVVAGWFGAGALASLSATQTLMRPVPLLASSWSMVARADLARRREQGDWSGFVRIVGFALAGGLVVAVLWTGLVLALWTPLSTHLFAGKYTQDRWMVVLWGLSAGIGFGQVVVSAGLQALRAFRPLALSNAAASAVAAGAVLVIVRIYGVGGSILGTAAGQGFEFAVMAAVLMVFLGRARSGRATAGG